MAEQFYYYTEERKSFFENIGSHLVDFIQTLVVFGAIFALIYLFVAQPHKVSGNSMVPTFHNGDYILTDKLSYRFGSPQRGDIIVLKNPRDETQDFIKRIIALPDDTLKVEGNAVYLNGGLLKEPYLPPATSTHAGSFLTEGVEIKAGANQYFVFGDNRNHSSDSREWGAITREEIVGKTFFRYWPPGDFGLVRSVP
ncbi:signal peptidase I [Candidatus Microgenomates bacterium]|nr:signal peptidase I [Candidatus Microgenomates bacterium]